MLNAFISYSRADEAEADRLARNLDRLGVHAFTDRDIAPGTSWADQLQKNLERSDVVFVLVSPNSEKSEHVAAETALAISRAREGRGVVVPVLLDVKSKPPFFLDHIQGITQFDERKAEQQLQKLVESLGSQRKEIGSENIQARLAYLNASREALKKEVEIQAASRVAWSTTIASGVVALAAIGTAAATLVTIKGFGNWLQSPVLAFLLGVLASLVASLVYRYVRQRMASRAAREGD